MGKYRGPLILSPPKMSLLSFLTICPSGMVCPFLVSSFLCVWGWGSFRFSRKCSRFQTSIINPISSCKEHRKIILSASLAARLGPCDWLLAGEFESEISSLTLKYAKFSYYSLSFSTRTKRDSWQM